MAAVARFGIYLLALCVVVTARLPQPDTGIAVTALRAPSPGLSGTALLVRLGIAGIILIGVASELRLRRTPWH